MGSPSEDMKRLREDIDNLRRNRHQLRDQLQADVQSLRTSMTEAVEEFRQKREENKGSLNDELVRTRAERTETISKVTADIHGLLSSFKKEMERIGVSGKKERIRCINRLQAEMNVTLAKANEKRREDSARMRSERLDFHKGLSKFRSEIQKQCEELRQETSRLHVESGKERTRQMNEFKEKAQQQKEQRQEFMDNLQGAVANIMSDCATFRAEMVSELAEMRSIWRSPGTQAGQGDVGEKPQEQKASKKTVQPTRPKQQDTQSKEKEDSSTPSTSEVMKKQPETTVQKVVERRQDKLSLITGIGPEREKQLYNAGIQSFKDLAQMDPEAIRNKLNIVLGDKTLQLWIDQARERTKQ